ncbi:hypothetical protein KCU65_g5809, partial [Aureobasidium melanogenum]
MTPPALPSLLEDLLYPYPSPPPLPRTKPMRVLCLGLSRSGTDSLRRALYILGFQHVWHGFNLPDPAYSALPAKVFTRLARRKFGTPGSKITREDFEIILSDCDAVTDTPASIFAPELISAYPEAKVILNVRDTEAWHKSFLVSKSRIKNFLMVIMEKNFSVVLSISRGFIDTRRIRTLSDLLELWLQLRHSHILGMPG